MASLGDDLEAELPAAQGTALAVVTPTPVTAAGLWAAGYHLAEIALQMGRSEPSVAVELAAAGCSPTPAHQLRIESAAIEAALPGTKWRESMNGRGDIARLDEYRAPDSKLASVALAALKPDVYGKAAGGDRTLEVIVRRLGAEAPPSARVSVDADVAADVAVVLDAQP